MEYSGIQGNTGTPYQLKSEARK